MGIRLAWALGLVLWAPTVWAADEPVYGPTPDWVRPAKPIESRKTPADQPARMLLSNTQVRFGPDADETYFEIMVRAQTALGLPGIGSVNQVWDPQKDVLTIHKLRILRGDQVIDLLALGKKFTVLRREENLEQSMVDGRLTATIQIEDVRVGDTLQFAATLKHHDPSFQARSEQVLRQTGGALIDHLYQRVVWPKATPVRWRQSAGAEKPVLHTVGEQTELVMDLTDVKPAKPPKMAPERFSEIGITQLSAYESWPQLSAALAPLFAKAAVLNSDSALHAELAQIRAASADPMAQAGLALSLVETKVRYVFLGEDLGDYKPAASDLTWTRRFGDCKGKTVLLVALLRALGFTADPVFVSTRRGDGLQDRLPGLAFFDHAIVRLSLGGKIYWLDATRTGDHDLTHLRPPPYRSALPLTTTGSELATIEQPLYTTPAQEIVLRVDAAQGLTAPAPAHVELVLRDDGALAVDQALHAGVKEELDKQQRAMWTKTVPWITPKTYSLTYDPAKGEAKFLMDGLAQLDWTSGDSGQGRGLRLSLADLGAKVDLKREPDTLQDAPYTVAFPGYFAGSETLILPDDGRGYRLEGRDLDRTVAGVRYRRKSQINAGVVETRVTAQALQREFPANEALTAQVDLEAMTNESVWVRAPLTYGQTLQEKKNLSVVNPTTTEDYFKRANEMFGKLETDKAMNDYNEVLKREPRMGAALVGRAQAHLRKGDLDRSLADLDQALVLQPDSLEAYYWRAEARLAAGRRADAIIDASAAVALAPNAAEPRIHRADLYRQTGALDQALADIDAALKIDPDLWGAQDERGRILAARGDKTGANAQIGQIGRTAGILNARCYGRAVIGDALDEALRECEAAVKLEPASAGMLDSRGFVWFRKGEWTNAIKDFDAALRLDPKLPTSLYVRGLAKRRQGDTVGGAADIAAAKALDAQVVHLLTDYGVALE